MEITLRYFDGCPNWKTTYERITTLISDRASTNLMLQRVESPEEAVRLGFQGSPTVLIDGRDPFGDPAAPVGLACRVYRTPDGMAGSPTIQQLGAAIEQPDETSLTS
ncbi:MAG: thioredoxin family protein [Actinobacteria bacterium]|nr:thioredoxin family protein [Actinomycetota bacterium]